MFVLLYAYSIPYFYAWTSIICIIVTGLVGFAMTAVGFTLLLHRSKLGFSISVFVNGGLFAALLIPGIIMLCYSFSGTAYYNSIRTASNVLVNDTASWKQRGFNVFQWADSKMFFEYYGWTYIPGLSSQTYNFVALIAPQNFVANVTIYPVPVFAVATLNPKYPILSTIDPAYIESRIFNEFEGVADSGVVSRMLKNVI